MFEKWCPLTNRSYTTLKQNVHFIDNYKYIWEPAGSFFLLWKRELAEEYSELSCVSMVGLPRRSVTASSAMNIEHDDISLQLVSVTK